jgi:hypothetical protein
MKYSTPLVLTLATLSPLSPVSAQWFTAPARNSAILVRLAAEHYRGSPTLSGAYDWESNSDVWSQALVAAVPGSGPVATPVGLGTQAPRRKEPVLAGALSFLIPFGAGSFYANNVGHGVLHLTLGGAAATLFFANLCVDSCSSGQETGMGIGFVAFAINWIAGTVVAVVDANTFNRRHRTPGAMALPMDRLTSPAFGSSPTNGRQLLVSLAHLSF